MTQDFRQDFIDSLQKEEFGYIIITFKDIKTGAHISTDMGDLNEIIHFNNKCISTKRESLIKLANSIINEEL